MAQTFEIKDKFYISGEPVQIISGAFHYFRTVPEYWRDRMEKLKNLGCNTVETYVPWNFHEENKGEYNFEGMHNLEKFLQTAKDLGLFVIIRPSPYICAEWEWGGLPAWLLADKNMKVRCMYEPFLQAVRNWYKILLPKIAPFQINRNGTIIMVQIENEYGYFGKDKKYLQFYADLMRQNGITVPFVTSDGPWGSAIKRGSLPNALPTGNFGSKVKLQFGAMQKKIGKNRPLMVMEFWCGWFDAWNDSHHTSNLEQNKKDLDEIMRTGNVNFYMFEGGTNFGFMNGRNVTTLYGDTTSYDYDGILTQDGKITPKYREFQKIIRSYKGGCEENLSTDIEYKKFGRIEVSRKTDLFSTLEKIAVPKQQANAGCMEENGQNYGYILYRLNAQNAKTLQMQNAFDRVNIFADQNPVKTAFGKSLKNKFSIGKGEKNTQIDLLCENLGRINFGKKIAGQRKGIESIKINGKKHQGLSIFNLPFTPEQIAKIDFDAGFAKGLPAFYEFVFNVEKPCDTFLNFEGFEKGCAFINGFNLGRYWQIGPQKKLYLPAPLLKPGKNTIILFESEGTAGNFITLDESDSW
ncbi:MAG: beta-galactosidase [Treponemataceae bacterium]|nr:beta-galactosidase [Treponemataceae bacterium]